MSRVRSRKPVRWGLLAPLMLLAPLLLAACSKPGGLSPDWSLAGSRVGVGGQAPVSVPKPPSAPPDWQSAQLPARSPVDAYRPPSAQPDRLIVPPRPVQVSRAQVPPNAAKPSTPKPAVASYVVPAKPGVVDGRPLITVAPGDTLMKIASAHKVSVAELMFVNNLRSLDVQPGQTLTIPSRRPARKA